MSATAESQGDGPSLRVSRSVSAEVRSRLAVMRISGKALAARIGVSQNYLAIRLRDERPLTLDDLDAIVAVIAPGETAWGFMEKAHSTLALSEAEQQRRRREHAAGQDQ